MALDVTVFPVTIAAGATSSPVINIGHNTTVRLAYGEMADWADSTGNQTLNWRAHLTSDQTSGAYSFVSGNSLVTYATTRKLLEYNDVLGVSSVSLEIATAPTQAATVYLLCGRNGPG